MATHLIAPDTTDDSRFERIDGQLVERPVPNTPHAIIQTQFLLLLTQALREAQRGKHAPNGLLRGQGMRTRTTSITSQPMSW